ncbi:MAG TPA: c-type cytochrome [Candidatus Binatia bacterium]|nr:c-type cytochrome [Candidatus Binatia bacterium]
MSSTVRTVTAALLVAAMPLGAAAVSDETKALYEKDCKACHSIAGEGGKMAKLGGALDDVGVKRDADWLRAYLKDPKSKMPDAKMPKVKLTDQELEDMVAYLLTLKTAPPK